MTYINAFRAPLLRGANRSDAVDNVDGKVMTHMTHGVPPMHVLHGGRFAYKCSVVIFNFAIWEGADYLYLWTVGGVLVLPPFQEFLCTIVRNNDTHQCLHGSAPEGRR